MKIIIMLGIASLTLSSVCDAASVIILDEGINTNQRWDAEDVTE